MLETTGDIWAHRIATKCITTNGYIRRGGCAVMGRGVALQAKSLHPSLPRELGTRLATSGNHVFYFQSFEIVTFPVKRNWWDVADLALIALSCMELQEVFRYNAGVKEIVMVRPGCGNGQLNWSTVKPLIAQLLDDRVTIIQV